MTTVVVGAGYTGRRLVARLGDRPVLVFTKSAAAGGSRLDLDRDRGLPAPLPPDYDVVYTVPPPSVGYVDPRLERFTSWLAPAPARFVYLSTTGVYGDRQGQRTDESTPPAPASARARRRLSAERLLERWCGAGTTLVTLRVPAIYGPGRLGVDRLQDGVPVIAESDARPGNRIHVDDLVGACIAALGRDVPAGIYNVGDGDERSATWFALEVARQLGIAPPPTISRAEAERTFSATRRAFLAESRRIDTTKMRAVLRFVPRFSDAREGIRASLAAESGQG